MFNVLVTTPPVKLSVYQGVVKEIDVPSRREFKYPFLSP